MTAVWWAIWAQACVMAGLLQVILDLLLKTRSKTVNNSQRIASLAGVAKTANTLSPLSTHVTALTSLAGNTLLPTLAQEFSPSTFGDPASNTNANLFSWANDCTARINQIYSTMQGTNLWT